MRWILIFYIGMAHAGGPSTATFDNQTACESAGGSIQTKWGATAQWLCVPSTTESAKQANLQLETVPR